MRILGIKWVQDAKYVGDQCYADTVGHHSCRTRPERAWLLAFIVSEPDAVLSAQLRDKRGVSAERGNTVAHFSIPKDELQKNVMSC
ncbi:hypothetical protein HK16_07095 [Acetobacter senegalensis]|uniref:Uncharacterized protein n=2 Tax=Acetobacter TaxID=434 RepID=A0A252EL28_9PROT|nr:hypothetical protein CIW82_15005 [Acetobacter tropicalis]OUL66954.1 hypothetical protein HK16_07095 [Acetobacter senegalensis]